MSNGIFQDKYGDFSSKRVAGLAIVAYCLVLATLDGFQFYSVNESLIISFLGIGAALLGLDSITDIWKKDEVQSDR